MEMSRRVIQKFRPEPQQVLHGRLANRRLNSSSVIAASGDSRWARILSSKSFFPISVTGSSSGMVPMESQMSSTNCSFSSAVKLPICGISARVMGKIIAEKSSPPRAMNSMKTALPKKFDEFWSSHRSQSRFCSYFDGEGDVAGEGLGDASAGEDLSPNSSFSRSINPCTRGLRFSSISFCSFCSIFRRSSV